MTTPARGNNSIDMDYDDFTVERYRELLRLAGKSYGFCSYRQIPLGRRFVLWRHDCDISLNRAARLAEVEHEEGAQATYFINLHSEFYNPLEKSQSKLIHQILESGHELGLHFDIKYSRLLNSSALEEQINHEKEILHRFFGAALTAVSFHNAQETLPALDQEVYRGLVNCNSKTLREQVPYVSDSNGYWRFRRLRDVLESAEDLCLQVLTHPVWWQDRPLPPWQKIRRSVDGRVASTLSDYEQVLAEDNRTNVGKRSN